jgi:ATP-dependent RNA helicase SUPV3L1/SUV3
MPSLLKPAAARLMAMLWALTAGKNLGDLQMPKPGLVSFPVSQDVQHAYIYALGYRPSGERAVRIDMLERLAQQIRTARNSPDAKEGFAATSQMMSLVGCSGEEFESILRSLGYRKQTIKRAAVVAPAEAAPAEASAEAAPTVEAPATEAAEPALANAAAETPVETAPAAPAETVAVTAFDVVVAQPAMEAAAPPAETEITVWRLAPRRPPQAKRPPKREERGAKEAAQPNREARGDRAPRRERDQKQNRDRDKDRGGGKKPFRKGDDAPPRQYSSAPRRERGPDPNSPFAVLAALKATMGGEPKSE